MFSIVVYHDDNWVAESTDQMQLTCRLGTQTLQENPLPGSKEGKKKDQCSMDKCFGGCLFNVIGYRCGQDSGGKIVKCDSEVLTEEYNNKVDEQKRCFPIVALVIVSE